MKLFFPGFLQVAALGMVFLFSLRAKSETTRENDPIKRPNIIVIVTDDHRWDMMGCAGNSIIQTPNMDKLAEEGVRFTHAFSSTPVCAASRASIITGLYERTHAFSFGTPPVAKGYSDISYPYLLKQAGYRTGIVGKFGVKLETPIDSLFSWKRVNGFPYWKMVDGQRRFLTDMQGDQAIEFIRQSAGDPFCLSISFSAPHADDDSKEQYFWPESLDSLYRSAVIPVPSTATPGFYESLPDFLKGTMNRERWYWRFDTPEKYQSMVKGYYRMITGVDQVIGRIRQTLDELKISDNTIIILLGDNGYFLGDRGYADKWLMHEASIRVPLIIYDPGKKTVAKKSVLSNMVLNVDVSPTILEFAGIKVPALVQGQSLVPFLDGRKAKIRSSVFCEHLMKNPTIPNSEGIRTDQWKFIRYPKHPEFVELYNLKTDPWEEHNLAPDPKYKNTLARFQRQCDQEIRRLNIDKIN